MEALKIYKTQVISLCKSLSYESSKYFMLKYLLMQATYMDVVCKDHQGTLRILKNYEFQSKLLIKLEKLYGTTKKEMTSQFS